MREGFFFMIQQIVKRDGRMAPFEIDKITNAIFGAAPVSYTHPTLPTTSIV